MDKYRKISPGGKLKSIPAGLYNTTVDMATAFEGEHSTSQRSIENTDPLTLFVVPPMAMPRFSIVGIGPSLGNTQTYRAVSAFPGHPFAITQANAEAEEITPALAAGVSQAKVLFRDETHRYARPVVGEFGFLESCSEPSGCKVLWSVLPTTMLDGAINSSVTTLETSCNYGFLGLRFFVVTIGTEDILVRRIEADSLIWEIDRGYNGTTAASHSDGDAVRFKSGVIWATVLLSGDTANQNAGGVVQITSTTKTGEYYPGKRVTWDLQTESWLDGEVVWVLAANGDTLEEDVYYGAFLQDAADQTPLLQARVYTASLGDTYTTDGTTITMDNVGSLGPFDGVTLAQYDRILFNPADEDTGVYEMTILGDGATEAELTRVAEMDADTDITEGMLIAVTEGTTNANSLWVLTTAGPTYTLNTTALTFAESTEDGDTGERAVWAVTSVPAEIDGSGTTNYVARWIDSDTLGIGTATDDDTTFTLLERLAFTVNTGSPNVSEVLNPGDAALFILSTFVSGHNNILTISGGTEGRHLTLWNHYTGNPIRIEPYTATNGGNIMAAGDAYPFASTYYRYILPSERVDLEYHGGFWHLQQKGVRIGTSSSTMRESTVLHFPTAQGFGVDRDLSAPATGELGLTLLPASATQRGIVVLSGEVAVQVMGTGPKAFERMISCRTAGSLDGDGKDLTIVPKASAAGVGYGGSDHFWSIGYTTASGGGTPEDHVGSGSTMPCIIFNGALAVEFTNPSNMPAGANFGFVVTADATADSDSGFNTYMNVGGKESLRLKTLSVSGNNVLPVTPVTPATLDGDGVTATGGYLVRYWNGDTPATYTIMRGASGSLGPGAMSAGGIIVDAGSGTFVTLAQVMTNAIVMGW